MITCAHCGHEFSSALAACPVCHIPVNGIPQWLLRGRSGPAASQRGGQPPVTAHEVADAAPTSLFPVGASAFSAADSASGGSSSSSASSAWAPNPTAPQPQLEVTGPAGSDKAEWRTALAGQWPPSDSPGSASDAQGEKAPPSPEASLTAQWRPAVPDTTVPDAGVSWAETWRPLADGAAVGADTHAGVADAMAAGFERPGHPISAPSLIPPEPTAVLNAADQAKSPAPSEPEPTDVAASPKDKEPTPEEGAPTPEAASTPPEAAPAGEPPAETPASAQSAPAISPVSPPPPDPQPVAPGDVPAEAASPVESSPAAEASPSEAAPTLAASPDEPEAAAPVDEPSWSAVAEPPVIPLVPPPDLPASEGSADTETTLRLSEILPDSELRGPSLFGISDDSTSRLSSELLNSAARLEGPLDQQVTPSAPAWQQPVGASVTSGANGYQSQVPDDLFRSRRIPTVADMAAAANAAASAQGVPVESNPQSPASPTSISSGPPPPALSDYSDRPPADPETADEDESDKPRRLPLIIGISAIVVGMIVILGLLLYYLYQSWNREPPPPTAPSTTVSASASPTPEASETPEASATPDAEESPEATVETSPDAVVEAPRDGQIPGTTVNICEPGKVGTLSSQTSCVFALNVAKAIPVGATGDFTIENVYSPVTDRNYALQCSTRESFYQCVSQTGATLVVAFGREGQ